MRRWAAKEPACARVVPRAEMKSEGVGVMDVSFSDQLEVSGETKGWSFASCDLGSRRETMWEVC